jgi:membrane protease YdiL (CAAX protease family)
MGLRGGAKPRLDVASLFLILASLATFLFGSTFTGDASFSTACLVGFSIMSAGILGIQLTGGFEVDGFFSPGEQAGSGGMVLVSLVAVAGINFGVRLSPFSVAPIGNALYLMLIAVAEEVFFRGFAVTFFARRFGDLYGSVLGAALFMIYHAQNYGWSNENLLIVLGCGVVLGLAYTASGYRLSVPALAHVAVNLLSALG